MGYLSSMLNGLANSLSIKRKKKPRNNERDGKKKELILKSSGIVNVEGSKNVACIFSKRGEKGTNQDRCIIWEAFGGEEEMMFCGVFDGHGPWGHFVANQVREAMPASLLSHWQPQHTLVEASDSDIWRDSYVKSCAAVDQELQQHSKIDTFYSGTTALTLVKQGEFMFIANVGDSRAVLGTSSQSGDLVAEQLTIDFKPNLPQEADRIRRCKGRIYSLDDEGGVERLWLPNEESPGLAMSRAFGDYCVKEFGLISVPQVARFRITSRDRFVVLATDGVWDVISNEEAVEMAAAAEEGGERSKSAKRVVECAARAWRRRRKGIAMDDISAIVLFFNSG